MNIKYLLSLKLDIFHDELTIYKKFIDKKYDYIMTNKIIISTSVRLYLNLLLNQYYNDNWRFFKNPPKTE